jgi:hypothetical protein
MYVRAVEGKNRSVIYISENGERLIRSGGKPAWRNNNPGNMKKGPKSRSLGSIGVAGGFAVFPDYKTGRDADRALLLTTYLRSSLYNMPKRYSPKGDRNNVERYRRQLRKFTGFDLKRTIRDLSPKEIEILLDAIQKIEGYIPGKEEVLGPPKQILDIKRDKKGKILSYLVEELGWLAPAEAVKGILEGEIDGVVVQRGGKSHVRTRPDSWMDNNIETKGRIK